MVLLDLERPFIERQNYVCVVPLNTQYIFYIQSNCIFHVFLNLLNHARCKSEEQINATDFQACV